MSKNSEHKFLFLFRFANQIFLQSLKRTKHFFKMINISFNAWECALILNFMLGSYMLGIADVEPTSKNLKGYFLYVVGGVLTVIFGVLVVFLISVYFVLEQVCKYLAIKAWFNLLRGKWDNMEGEKRENFINFSPGYLKSPYFGPIEKYWIRLVAKRNGIEL